MSYHYECAIELPGNIAQQLAIMRQSLFAHTLDPLARAFPEHIVLESFCFAGSRLPANEKTIVLLAAALQKACAALPKSISAQALIRHGEMLFLQVAPSLDESRKILQATLEALKLTPVNQLYSQSECIFLGRALQEMPPLELPSFNVRRLALGFFEVYIQEEPLLTARWKALQVLHCRTRTQQ